MSLPWCCWPPTVPTPAVLPTSALAVRGWAIVKADGTVEYNSGIVFGITHSSLGIYDVTVETDVTGELLVRNAIVLADVRYNVVDPVGGGGIVYRCVTEDKIEIRTLTVAGGAFALLDQDFSFAVLSTFVPT